MQKKSLPWVWLFRSLLATALLIFLGILAGGFYLKKELSPERVSSELTKLLDGRGFIVETHDFRFTWSGNFELSNICIRHKEILSKRCTFSAGRIFLDLKLLALLKKKIIVQGVTVVDSDLNFFTEEVVEQGKKNLVESWRVLSPTPHENVAASSQSDTPQIELKNIRIERGRLHHEARVLPWPLGETAYALQVAQGRSIDASATLPDKSTVRLEINPRFENLTEILVRLFSGKPWNAQDAFAGKVELEKWDISPWVSRAQTVSGKFVFEMKDASLTLMTENATLMTRIPYAAACSWKGSIVLSFPHFTLQGGEGTVRIPAGSFAYRSLREGDAGISLKFSGDFNLASFAKGMAEGNFSIQGEVQNSQVNASWSAKNLSVKNGEVQIGAPTLAGVWKNSIVSLTRQNLTINGLDASASLTANLSAAPPTVVGNIRWGVLDLKKFLNPSQASSVNNKSAENNKSGIAEEAPQRGGVSLDIKMDGKALRYANFTSHAWSAKVQKTQNGFAVRNVNVAVGRGWFQGEWVVSGNTHTVFFKVNGVETQALKPLFESKATVYAPLTAQGRVAFSGKSLSALVQTGVGEVSLKLGRGKIRDSFFQKGIFTGPLHKLEQKFTDVEFASLSAQAKLRGGKVQIDKIFLDAEEFQLSLRAEANSDAVGKAALHFRFNPSFIENVANPLYLGITERKEGEFYDLPFACRGDVLKSACYVKNW